MSLPEDNLKCLYDVFQSLKHPEDNNGNDDCPCGCVPCCCPSYGESEASEEVGRRLIDGEAMCRNGSEDEVFHDKDYDNQEEKDFIDDREDQQHNTSAHHRRRDNEHLRDHFQDDSSFDPWRDYVETMDEVPCDTALRQDDSDRMELGVQEVDLDILLGPLSFDASGNYRDDDLEARLGGRA